jgi:hypothetical protein
MDESRQALRKTGVTARKERSQKKWTGRKSRRVGHYRRSQRILCHNFNQGRDRRLTLAGYICHRPTRVLVTRSQRT